MEEYGKKIKTLFKKIIRSLRPYLSGLFSPLVRTQKGGRSMHVCGWVFFKDGRGVKAVRVVSGKKVDVFLKHSFSRPDIQKRYPQYNQAVNSGFMGDVFLPAGLTSSLHLAVQDIRGTWYDLKRFSIQFPTITEMLLENSLGSYAFRWLMGQAVPQPIVVAGMHRSGTRVVCQILGKLGVQMGAYLDANYESFFFQSIHMSLLQGNAEDWRDFGKTLALLDDPSKVRIMAADLKKEIEKRLYANHFGIRSFGDCLRYMRDRKDTLWGWKDPRAMLFLPLWRQLFPAMKVIFIVRHPKDVCLSLCKRDGIPLAQCFDLWKKYNRLGNDFLMRYSGQTLLIHYEKLREDATLRRLVAFVGRSADIGELHSLVRPSGCLSEETSEVKKLDEKIHTDSLVRQMGYVDEKND